MVLRDPDNGCIRSLIKQAAQEIKKNSPNETQSDQMRKDIRFIAWNRTSQMKRTRLESNQESTDLQSSALMTEIR
ncbi:hypothetical protein TNCV_1998271 [Trichonephila clavipes]|nr:hypothetical protein TNCV_1998271 [Trichonephila clavipes]